MGNTLTVRIDDDLNSWLEKTARKRGVSKGRLVRDQLERGRRQTGAKLFMRLAGSVALARNLSARKGFSKR
jgi:hypothetical protein